MARTHEGHVDVSTLPPHDANEFPIAALGADEDERKKNIITADLELPRKFAAGMLMTAEQAAQLDALFLRVFTGNFRSYVLRGGKKYEPHEVIEAWNKYELGAPRERTGETLRHKAGYMFVQEWLAAKNAERAAAGQKLLAWPRAVKGKLTAAEADEKREAMIQKALTSDNADTQRRIVEIEAELRAEQAAARAKPDAGAEALEDEADF